MSSFLNSSFRKANLSVKSKVKRHTKAFYRILDEMTSLAKELKENYPDASFNEDNVNEYAEPLYGRKLDSMEKFLVLGKMFYADNN